jgi:hypothetical protein
MKKEGCESPHNAAFNMYDELTRTKTYSSGKPMPPKPNVKPVPSGTKTNR